VFDLIVWILAAALMVTMVLALVRALMGPAVHDRVVAVNLFGTKTVLLLAAIAWFTGQPDYLDLALAYALINFISVIAVLEFIQNRSARQARERVERGLR
jgi:multicomponent Na+:H+ antiporter subunit F